MTLPKCILTFLLTAVAAGANAGVTIHASLNTPTMAASGGSLFLQLSFEVPRPQVRDRSSLNLSVVLDRSGSMAERSHGIRGGGVRSGTIRAFFRASALFVESRRCG